MKSNERGKAMKAKMMIGMLVGLVVAASAMADGGTKTVVLDTGKRGTRLTVSVPDFADGPYDFSKNPGVGKADDGIWNHQTVMFNAALGESGVVVYMATLDRIDPAKTKKRLTTEYLAQARIDASGFSGRATQINCPPAPIEGAKTACYKMSGDSIFDGKALPEKAAQVLAVVSFANDTQGYTLMGTVVERNVAKFNADPATVETRASKSLSFIWKNLQFQAN